MKTITLGWIAALGITSSVLGFSACSQPKTECQVGLASTGYSYVAKYKVKGSPSAACMDKVKLGETFGMEFYHPATSDKSTYDGTKTTLAIESDDVGSVISYYGDLGGVDPCAPAGPCAKDDDCGDPGLKCVTGYCAASSCSALHAPWGGASFTSTDPDDKDMCAAPKVATAEADLPETIDDVGAVNPDDGSTLEDTDCTTDEDCRFLVDPEDPMSADPASGMVCDTAAGKCVPGCYGTGKNGCVAPAACSSTDDALGDCKLPPTTIKYEWSNLKFYVTAGAPGTQFSGDLKYTEDDCTIEYTAVGMWPAVGCATDDDCNPCANPDAGLTIGSGISPDFPTKCDTDLGICVLTDAKDPTKDAESIPQILSTPKDCGKVE